ncbi:MAG: ArgE/DapE family deacylase [Gemmatimonadaceae bacterium]
MSSGAKRADAVELTRALTRIDSRNPTLVPGAPGEKEIARFLADILSGWGFLIELRDAIPNRPNVVARIGPAGSPALVFAGHLDTVGVEGMTHAPFDAEIRGEKIFGRGSTDMKSGIASMCVATKAAAQAVGKSAKRQIIIAAVVDEEYASIGMRELVASGITADAAVLTEPTRLAICPAHRGFVWVEVVLSGRAAHGSRYDIGVDAIRHAALVLAELDKVETEDLPRRAHKLLGRGSLHASAIEGGSGLSTYPDRCVFTIERRTLPGETAEDALDEVRAACERVRTQRPELSAQIRLIESQLPSDVSVDAPVVEMLKRAMVGERVSPIVEGMSAWTDAAILNSAGIPAICFGPGDISLAHAKEEFVAISEIEQATAVLTRMARDWLSEKT